MCRKTLSYCQPQSWNGKYLKFITLFSTEYGHDNNSICLSSKISKSTDPLQNIHTVQFEVVKGDKSDEFVGYIGLTSETNVAMLNQEC